MQTQAYFSDISLFLARELETANECIHVAVAWFTDPSLFRILCRKASDELDVQLIVMDDDITRNFGLEYSLLEDAGGRVYMVDGGPMGNTMHNKFCVIDGKTTITGSYNWSIKAQSNHENITITTDNPSLAASFEDEFQRIKVHYHGKDPLKPFDFNVVVNRLKIIDNLIQLEETGEINEHLNKLKVFQLTTEVEKILQLADAMIFSEASAAIREYLQKASAVAPYQDTDAEHLKWEIRYLEIEIITLETEKASILKVISDFVYFYNLTFGEMLLEILKLKKEKLKAAGFDKKSKRFQKAEEAYRQQEQNFEQAKEETHFELNQDELAEIKAKYRKACTLCHPDKFEDEISKTKTTEVFIELQKAYQINDLKRVSEILDNLEKGIFDIGPEQDGRIYQSLQQRVQYLRQRLDELTKELNDLRNDKSYSEIMSIDNMDSFFEKEKNRLENELKQLKNEQ
jgi:hypothetical protein